MNNDIRYLSRKNIETEKWDACIQRSANGLCYSDSHFLDAMSPGWSGLVLNDYEAVMPLTWRKKFGIHYLFQPAFSQQGGITSLTGDRALTEKFLATIPRKFKYWDIQLNATNSSAHYPCIQRKNYLLSLAPGARELAARYHRNAIRNIRTALAADVAVREDIPISSLMKLHKARFASRSRITEEEYSCFSELLGHWSQTGKAILIGAQNKYGEIVASSGYLVYKDRLTFIINGNNPEGLSKGASFLLKDHLIRKYAGSDYILDFEGSDKPAFARFYEQFGAEPKELYPRIIRNRLPWALRFLKR